jgi:hypothetical protein
LLVLDNLEDCPQSQRVSLARMARHVDRSIQTLCAPARLPRALKTPSLTREVPCPARHCIA